MISEQKKAYNFDKKKVFDSMKDALTSSKFVIKSYDEAVSKITATTPPSWFSYGEMIEIIISAQDDGSSIVYVKAESRAFFNLTSGSSVKKDVDNIFLLLDKKIS